jgi:GT2 family glycosyltransferase
MSAEVEAENLAEHKCLSSSDFEIAKSCLEDKIPPVTVVVVTYQSAQTLPRALPSLKRGHQTGLLDAIFVDNDSRDATVEILRLHASWATVLATGVNNGFGRGCNLGAANIVSPYTLFLNPDAILEPEDLQVMLDFMNSHPKAGVCGPAIVEGANSSGQGKLQFCGPRPTPATIVWNALPFTRHSPNNKIIEPNSDPFPTGWVCGAVLMIRTPLLHKLKGFDPRFFLYWEETDLCMRTELAGYSVWAVGKSVAQHVGGASSSPDDTRIGGCIALHYLQSRYYYMLKHYGWIAANLAELVDLTMCLVMTMADLLRGRKPLRLRTRLQARPFSLPKMR